MKANRAFRSSDDDAVSPVIAVILMVAITVVLAATIYVWVSGFGSNASQPAQTISFTKSTSGTVVTYTVSAATPGLKWNGLKITVSGTSNAYTIVTSAGDTAARSASGTLSPSSTSVINAGDQIYLVNGGASALSGATLQILDVQANSVMATIPGATASAASAAGATNLASSVTRSAGTAGDFQTSGGSTTFTLSAPIDMSTLAIGDIVEVGGHGLGSATLTVLSPTQFKINWNGGAVVTGDTIRITSGAVNDMTGAATTGATTFSALTAAM